MNTLRKYRPQQDGYDPKHEEIAVALRPVRRKLLGAVEVTEEAGYSTATNTVGMAHARPGDILVHDETGNLRAMPPDQFAREFEYADVPAPEGFGTAAPRSVSQAAAGWEKDAHAAAVAAEAAAKRKAAAKRGKK